MAIVANTELFSRLVLHKVDYRADTLAEIEAAAMSYIGKFFLLVPTGQIFKVLEDGSVEWIKLSLGGQEGESNDTRLYIQPDAPNAPAGVKYVWIQTEYNGPNGVTVWYEDLT